MIRRPREKRRRVVCVDVDYAIDFDGGQRASVYPAHNIGFSRATSSGEKFAAKGVDR